MRSRAATARPTAIRPLVLRCMLPGFPGATVPDWVREALDDGLAGVVVYGQNASAPGVVERLGRELRALRPDALVAVDEEGGDVTRLHQHQGSPQPGNAALGRVDDPELTRRLARLTALELRAAGYNLNFAPVADLDEEALSAVIGLRSFGGDPDGVGAHVAAAVAGLQEAGVAACPKHFPGHGATRVDSHLSLPRVEEPLEVLMRRELVPFRAGVAAGARCVMTAHIVYPAIDEQPATLSRAVLIGLLRETLAFEGVIVTDALEMRAVRDQYGIAGAAVRALAAGADLLCLGAERGGEDAVHAVIDAVAAALADGTLTAGRLEEAGARVDALRHWCATAPPADGAAMEAGDGTLPLEVARRALAADGRVPRSDAVALLEVRAPANQAVGSTAWGLAPALGAQGGLAAAVAVEEEPHDVDALLQPLEGLPLVVVTRDAVTRPWQRALVARVLARRPDAVLVAMGTPRDLDLGAGRGVSTAGAGRVNATAAAERLLRSRRPREGGDRGDVKDAGRPGARMAAEMLEQPAVLERIGERRHEWAAALRALLPDPLAGIVLVARGSSDHAAVWARYAFEVAGGRPVALAAPSLHTLYDAKVDLTGYLAVAISQSGRTPEIVTVLDRFRAAGAIGVAITNEADSPLGAHAELLVHLDAGPEKAVPATKTFTAQLAALAALAEGLGPVPWGDDDWRRLPESVATVLADGAPADDAARRIGRPEGLVAVGRGYLYAGALEAALKLKETTGILAEGYSAADLRHGPVAVVDRSFPVLSLRASGPAAADMADLESWLARERGAQVIRIADEAAADLAVPPGLAEALMPIPVVVRAQQLSRALAIQSGVDPDQPFGLAKVTRTV